MGARITEGGREKRAGPPLTVVFSHFLRVSLLLSLFSGITNGVFADFFTVAVRTGGEGMGGVSLLLIERSEGVKTTQMKCQGVWASGTT